jgi:hypothetical protein
MRWRWLRPARLSCRRAHLAQPRHHVGRGHALFKVEAAAAAFLDAGNEGLIPHHLRTCGVMSQAARA